MNKKEERDGIDFKRGSWVRIGGPLRLHEDGIGRRPCALQIG